MRDVIEFLVFIIVVSVLSSIVLHVLPDHQEKHTKTDSFTHQSNQ